MFKWLGRLAAVVVARKRRVKGASTAASFLILTLLTTGCSGLLDSDRGSRLFSVLAKLWELLPSSVPTTPYDFFVLTVGEDYAERYADIMLGMVQFPNLEEGILGDVLRIALGIMIALIVLYSVKYFWRIGDYIDRFGADQVNAGATAIVPPGQYLVKRFAPTLFIVVGSIRIIQISVRFTSELITKAGLALYESQGVTVESVITDLFVRMLEGLKVWMVLFMIVFVGLGGLGFLTVYIWRYLSVFIHTVRLFFRTPRFLDGENPGSLTEPLEKVLHRILVLAITWFWIIAGPLLIWSLEWDGFPVILGVWASLVLAIWTPWILFRFVPPVSEGLHNLLAPIDKFTRVPTAGLPDGGEKVGIGRRVWNSRVLRPIKSVGRVGVEVAKREPHVGPAVAAVTDVVDEVKRGDPAELGRDISDKVYRGRRYSVSSGAVVGGNNPTSSSGNFPAFDHLIDAVVSSGLHRVKNDLSDSHFAMAATLVAAGYGVSTIEQVKEDARDRLRSVSPHDLAAYEEMGQRLKRQT